MQRQRSWFDPLPETVDLNQGSVANNTGTDQLNAWNNMLNPVESRLSNYALSSSEANYSYVGESSSSANPQQHSGNDGSKMEHSYFHSGPEISLEERRFGSSNSFLPSNFDSNLGGNQVTRGPFNMQSSGSSHTPMSVNLNFNNGYGGGPSSGNSSYLVEDVGGSGSSLGGWGPSCKRKSLEGTSAQSFPSGSSSCFPQGENTLQYNLPSHTNASSSLNISNPHMGSHPEQMNHFGVRLNPGHQDSGPFNLLSSGSHVRPSPRQISLNEFLDSRPTASPSTNITNPSHQPHLMHVPGLPRNMLPYPWNGTSSSSSALQGERSAEASFRNTLMNTNMDHPNLVLAPDARNVVQDPTRWSLGTGNSSASGGVPSSSRNSLGPTSSSRSFPTLLTPHHDNSTQSQQRVSEIPPWTLFPSAEPEPESGGQRGHFNPFPSGSSSSSSEEAVISSGINSQGRHRTFPRSSLLMEVPGDDWRALATDMEGRHRLVSEIRQVLNAMRRGENLRAEDYTFFDPYISGVAELHDRHRDMRLDVDNMSYEELLALEDRIGNVSTGLTEQTIMETMKQRKHLSFLFSSPPQNLEPCCVCQEEYVAGDFIGTLDCGHDFHTDCIKQWLTQKNLCPICKMTGLNT